MRPWGSIQVHRRLREVSSRSLRRYSRLLTTGRARPPGKAPIIHRSLTLSHAHEDDMPSNVTTSVVVNHFTARASYYNRSSRWCTDQEMLSAMRELARCDAE